MYLQVLVHFLVSLLQFLAAILQLLVAFLFLPELLQQSGALLAAGAAAAGSIITWFCLDDGSGWVGVVGHLFVNELDLSI